MAAQSGVKAFDASQTKAAGGAKATAASWNLATREIKSAQQAVAGLSQQQQAAARQAASTRFTGGIGTVGTARAATATELRGARGGVGQMDVAKLGIREATKARQDLERAQRSADRAAKDEQRTVIAGQRAWDAMAITLGGNERVLAQTRRAKDQLRAAVASGAITQDKANAALTGDHSLPGTLRQSEILARRAEARRPAARCSGRGYGRARARWLRAWWRHRCPRDCRCGRCQRRGWCRTRHGEVREVRR